MRTLFVLAGPIGAGKTTVARLVARRAVTAGAGRTAVDVDLDDLAFEQHGVTDVDELWRRASTACAALIDAWLDLGVDVVVTHGPYFETGGYDRLLAVAARHPDVRVVHVLLRVPLDVAAARVDADPERPPTALSRDPRFLATTHETFARLEAHFPPVDLEVDTTAATPREIAGQVVGLAG